MSLNWVNISFDDGLSPVWHQTIIWTKDDFSSITPSNSFKINGKWSVKFDQFSFPQSQVIVSNFVVKLSWGWYMYGSDKLFVCWVRYHFGVYFLCCFTTQEVNTITLLLAHTVETLYNTVNFCWNTHKRHSIARPKGRGMGCLLWVQRATYCVDLSKLSSIKYLLSCQSQSGVPQITLSCYKALSQQTYLVWSHFPLKPHYNTSSHLMMWLKSVRPT